MYLMTSADYYIVNIWSHIVGAVCMLLLLPISFHRTVPPRYLFASRTDLLVFMVYVLGTSICFLLSAVFHLVYHHSPETCQVARQFDFLGIVLLMWSASVPLVYYNFLQHPQLQILYWTIQSLLAASCATSTFKPRFSHPTLQHLRVRTFGSLALTFFIIVCHGIYIHGINEQKMMGLMWVLSTASINAIAATAYITKFPESWWPRSFDIFGSSHQLLHVLSTLR